MLTKFEVFQKVKTHLLAQGKRATVPGVGCAYRGEGGTKCAVGCLIADEHYSPRLEGYAVARRFSSPKPVSPEVQAIQKALFDSGVPEDAIPMLADLQAVHDIARVDLWGSELDKVAEKHDALFMTKQEVFDKVKDHLLAQNAKALRGAGSETCQYRAPDGKKCAAGCLIPDSHYSADLEGAVVFGDPDSTKTILRDALFAGGVPEDAFALVEVLQRMHDNRDAEPREWPARLASIASAHGLKFELTEQQIYDKVKTHLLTQGKKAKEGTGKLAPCKYLAPDGSKCAAGCLIAPEHYSPAFENSIVQKPTASDDREAAERFAALRKALIASGVPASSFPFVRRLQSIHDEWEPIYWEQRLRGEALEHGLTP